MPLNLNDKSVKYEPPQISAKYDGVLLGWKAWNFNLLHLFQPISTSLLSCDWPDFNGLKQGRRWKFPAFQLAATFPYSADGLGLTMKIWLVKNSRYIKYTLENCSFKVFTEHKKDFSAWKVTVNLISKILNHKKYWFGSVVYSRV